MATPQSLLLTSSGDLDTTLGVRLTGTIQQFVTQKLRARLNFFLGEWFLDQRLGVSYWQRVFIENPDVSLLSSLYRKIILGTRGVASFSIPLRLRLDRKLRTLFVTFSVRCVGSPETVDFVDEPFVLKP